MIRRSRWRGATSSVRTAAPVFFPLDDQLGLLSTGYSPFVVEAIVRLGTCLPFEQVPAQLAFLLGVQVSADTVRRLTEQAGALQVAVEDQALARLEREAPADPEGPVTQQLSGDGAMVPLQGGRWAEARTIAIGTVEASKDGEPVHTTKLSYFSRLCSADRFIRLATLPTHERGTRRAGTVVAVMDGASWLQELIDEQCPHAVRILDFAHAAGYLTAAAHATYGSESPAATDWLDTWVPTLKAGTPEAVLAALRALPASTPEAIQERRTAIASLAHRLDQIRYADFQAKGYPIGSGIVESAGKLVVEARLKGSGMHWAPRHVTPVLALRGMLCSGQWEQKWPLLWQRWRSQLVQRRADRWKRHRDERGARTATMQAAEPRAVVPKPKPPKTVIDGKPTPAHPWKGGCLIARA